MSTETARCHLHTKFVSNAIPLLTFLEKSFGELEKNELIDRVGEYIETRFPNSALQVHADVLINYAVHAMHGDGPQKALTAVATDLLKLDSEQDVMVVDAILTRFLQDAAH